MYRNITSTILVVLYALNADRLYRENKVKGRIVVKSPDTDVLVLLIHYFPQMTKGFPGMAPMLYFNCSAILDNYEIENPREVREITSE
jgi:hypothetical protein